MKTSKLKLRILIVFIFFNVASHFIWDEKTINAEECQWVKVKGSAYLANITPEQARALAKRAAMEAAIAKVAGVEIKSETIVKDFQLQADLIKTLSQGVIVKEKKIKKNDWEIKQDVNNPGNSLLTLNYSGCVKKLAGERDAYFKVKLQMKEQTFIEGDQTSLQINCTADCYLTIANITADNKVYILYPDKKYFKDNFLKAGEVFIFPPQEFQKAGLKLKVKLLKGQKENIEIIYVIATKKYFDFYQALCKKSSGRGFCKDKNSAIPLEDFLIGLSEIPLPQRDEDVAVYVIKEK